MSWFKSNFSVGSHLDNFFVSRNLNNNIIFSSISMCLSDHDFVHLHMLFDNIIHWVLVYGNLTLFHDSAFCDLVKSCIVDSFSDVKDWWEILRLLSVLKLLPFEKIIVDAPLESVYLLLIA